MTLPRGRLNNRKREIAAIPPGPGEDFMVIGLPLPKILPNAANDNQLEWPLIPFPQGRNAAGL